jgi:hypothetical protein
MNTLTQDEQDEQTLSVFDLQDEMDAMRQAIMDYECLESSRLWEEYMEMARQQLTPSDSEEDNEERSDEEQPNRLDILCQAALQEQPTQLIGRKRRYSEIEESEDEEDFCEQDCGCDLCEEGIPEEYEEDGIGKCGFRCDDRCPICEDGGFDSRDET